MATRARRWTGGADGAGNGSIVSHPRPPILNLFGTHSLTVQDCVLTDATGMMFPEPGHRHDDDSPQPGVARWHRC